jgi:hypothetical protein
VLQSLALLRQSYDSGTLLSTDGDADEPDPLITVEFRTDSGLLYRWSARYAPELDVLPLADVILPSDLPEL